jgi:hypothetical protein
MMPGGIPFWTGHTGNNKTGLLFVVNPSKFELCPSKNGLKQFVTCLSMMVIPESKLAVHIFEI